MAEINLKLLQSFLLVALHGSFRKAAEAAHRSPSAISMQIKELEDQIGIRLFVREAKQTVLTPDGRRLFDNTEPAMAQIIDGFRALSTVAANRQSSVTIACAPTLAPQQISGALRHFRKRVPDGTIRLIEATPSVAVGLLNEQIAAFYVGPQPNDMRTLHYEHLMYDQLQACIPPEFDDGKPYMTFEDLGARPIIILEKPAAIRSLIDTITRQKSLTLNLAFEMQNAFTALHFASAGLGIALLPAIAVKIAHFEGFRVVPFEEDAAVRSIGITSRRGAVQNTDAERLLGLIRGTFAAT